MLGMTPLLVDEVFVRGVLEQLGRRAGGSKAANWLFCVTYSSRQTAFRGEGTMANLYWAKKRWARRIRAFPRFCIRLVPVLVLIVALVWHAGGLRDLPRVPYLTDFMNRVVGTTDQCNIKGNISRRGERIYHVPGGRYYDATWINPLLGERWFCSEAEATAAGWRRSRL